MTAICCAVRRCLYAVLFATIAATALTISLHAQDTGENAGPIPPALIAAKTVFISNAGQDADAFPAHFNGDPARCYAIFYQHLKATGAFQLVDSPAQADLIFELSQIGPHRDGISGKPSWPVFRLTILDRPSHYILWTESQAIEPAERQKTHDRNSDTAIDELIRRVLKIAGRSAQPATH